jgi:hypothetical protein
MSVFLHLPVKGEYFDKIKDGSKPEEFRLCTPYWRRRIDGKVFAGIWLTRGYPSIKERDRWLTRPWRGYEVKVITHPHFGPKPVEVYAIRVGAVDSTGAGKLDLAIWEARTKSQVAV